MDRPDILKKTIHFALAVLLAVLAQNAFAEEALTAKNEMYSQRGRLLQISKWLSERVLGENNEGLLVVRGKSKGSVERAIKDENEEREKMFKELSQKKGTTVMEQRKLYAKSRRKEAPKGSPVQEADGSWSLKA